MECIRCQSQQVVKAGFKKLKQEKVQQYRCKECKSYFTGGEKYHRTSEEKIELMKRMFEEKGEQRKIARVFGVGLGTVQWHLKK